MIGNRSHMAALLKSLHKAMNAGLAVEADTFPHFVIRGAYAVLVAVILDELQEFALALGEIAGRVNTFTHGKRSVDARRNLRLIADDLGSALLDA